MQPAELAEAIIKLGICYQMVIKQKGFADILSGMLPPKEEDFSELGYNKKEQEEKEVAAPTSVGSIITDPAELMKYDGWHLSMNIPKEFPKAFSGPHYTAFIFKRRLTISGNDYPWSMGAVQHKFHLEYIKDVKLHNNIFLVLTTFGQTGIVLN